MPEKLEREDKWVLSKLNTLIREVTDNMEAFELGVASAKIYDFIWDTYCDWYIELTKSRLSGENEQARLAAENVLCYVLLRLLELLHPFMPFLTEEIWQALPHEGDFLIRARWPEYREELSFPEDEDAMEAVKDAISAVRARRAEMNVPPSKKAQVIIAAARPEHYEEGRHFITRMAFASEVTVSQKEPEDLSGMVTVVTHGANVYMPLKELVDLDKERERIAKELEKARENLARLQGKLANESFVSRAPEAVVNAEREKLEKAKTLIEKLEGSAAAMGL
ncbi:MAG: class I tRNA ligase family protein [Oscillospiraceae bacterium]|nr:class I tRNA ligase family protein [Oscillospiraceae bacterium]